MEYVISSPPKNICLNNDEGPKRRLVIVEDFSFMKFGCCLTVMYNITIFPVESIYFSCIIFPVEY